MYPVTGYYGVLQAVKLNSIKTFFSFYNPRAVSGNGFSELYLSVYESNYPDRTFVWKKVALDSDLTDLSNSINTSLKNYLPLIGGLMSGTINTSKTTSTYRNGNLGESIINSTAANGSYTVLAKMNSTNGKFTLACYQGKMLLQYTSNATIATEENRVDKSITLMDERGATSLSTWTISKGTNGWMRENSTGFTIQWGYGRDSRYENGGHDEHSNVVVTLPRAFTIVYGIWAGNVGSVGKYSCYVWNITKTKFNMGGSDNSDGNALPYWWAVGIS